MEAWPQNSWRRLCRPRRARCDHDWHTCNEEHKKKVESFTPYLPVECRGGKVVSVIQGHEEEKEILDKTLQLLRKETDLVGHYISTECIPVCSGGRKSRIGGEDQNYRDRSFP